MEQRNSGIPVFPAFIVVEHFSLRGCCPFFDELTMRFRLAIRWTLESALFYGVFRPVNGYGQVEFRIERNVDGSWLPTFGFYRQPTTSDNELAWESYDWLLADIGWAWHHPDQLDLKHTWDKLSLPNWLIVLSLVGLNATAAAPRHWFRFRLRTLLVLLVICSFPLAWAGYSLNWIRQRRALGATKGISVRYAPQIRPPGALWLFGEAGAGTVDCWEGSGKIEVAKKLFPEAEVRVTVSSFQL